MVKCWSEVDERAANLSQLKFSWLYPFIRRTCFVFQMWRCPPLILISFSGEFWAKCKKFRLSISNGVRIIKRRRNLDLVGHASYLECGGAPHPSLSYSQVNSEQCAKKLVSLSRTVFDSSKKPRLGSTRTEMRTYLVPRMRRCPPPVSISFSGEFWAICKKFRPSISNGVRLIKKDETLKPEDWNADIPRTSNAEVPPTRLYLILWWILSNMQKISSLYLERCPIHPKSRTLEGRGVKCEHTSYLECGGAPLLS